MDIANFFTRRGKGDVELRSFRPRDPSSSPFFFFFSAKIFFSQGISAPEENPAKPKAKCSLDANTQRARKAGNRGIRNHWPSKESTTVGPTSRKTAAELDDCTDYRRCGRYNRFHDPVFEVIFGNINFTIAVWKSIFNFLRRSVENVRKYFKFQNGVGSPNLAIFQ